MNAKDTSLLIQKPPQQDTGHAACASSGDAKTPFRSSSSFSLFQQRSGCSRVRVRPFCPKHAVAVVQSRHAYAAPARTQPFAELRQRLS